MWWEFLVNFINDAPHNDSQIGDLESLQIGESNQVYGPHLAVLPNIVALHGAPTYVTARIP